MAGRRTIIVTLMALGVLGAACGGPDSPAGKTGPERTPSAPLYRDPVFDGAADPSLVWNDQERAWWVFYTNRRANAPDAQDGVRWCHGTDIGIASSTDGGRTWAYRGIAKGLEFEAGRNTFWAPCLVEHGRTYHMFLAYVRGVPADWSGDRHIVHYTSRNLVDWKNEGIIPLELGARHRRLRVRQAVRRLADVVQGRGQQVPHLRRRQRGPCSMDRRRSRRHRQSPGRRGGLLVARAPTGCSSTAGRGWASCDRPTS